MLEAVNSVLSNASYTKAIADQQSVATSYAANPERVQQATTQAPYISLYIKVDTNFDKAVLQIRDSDTGDVVRQIPTESQLEAYRRAQTSNAVRAPEHREVKDLYSSEDVSVQQSPAPQAQNTAPTPSPAPTQTSAAPAPSVPTAPQGGGSSPTPAPVSIDTQV